jgi:hypothetical protein
MSRFAYLGLALLAYLGATGASAHDFGSLTHPSNTTTDAPASAGGINLQALDPPTRSVIVNTSKWPVGHVVKVCFYEGSSELRRSISESAMKWFDGGGINLSLDFGTAPSYRTCSSTAGPNGFFEDIRIGYRAAGLWSYIGVDSHRVSGASMNFQNYDKFSPDGQTMTEVVLHEFGHALGLHHEHQSPGAPCDGEFNIPLIKQRYGWSDADIATNITALQHNSSTYSWSGYDPTSIMMYSLSPDLFLRSNSPCQVPQNYVLSPEDKQAIRRAYPTAPAEIAERTRGPSEALAQPGLPQDVRRRAEIQQKLSAPN